MRFQPDGYSCGPVAAMNVIQAMTGRRPHRATFLKDSGTSKTNGTTHFGLQQAIERAGFKPVEIAGAFDTAYETLQDCLAKGWGAVLLTERGNHWIAAVGRLGERVAVFDSFPHSGHPGVHVYSRTQLRRVWTPCGPGGRYAIAVTR